jgi:serpin B
MELTRRHFLRLAGYGLGSADLLLGWRAGAAEKHALIARPDWSEVVRGNNAFALDLYARLDQSAGNLFFSPYSISTALAMTYAGARGPTADEMARTLHFPMDQRRLHPAFAQLLREMDGTGKKRPFQLQVANALWGQENYGFLKPFLDLTRTHYGAGLREVDFAGATEKARQTINGWVEEQTKDKIKELLKPGILHSLTRLVLTNAIYFKAAWASPFSKGGTKEEDFRVTPRVHVKVPMMHLTENFHYFEDDTLQVLQLPYEGHAQSMLIFLPREEVNVLQVEKTLTENNLDPWLKKMKEHRVRVALPRFKVTHEFQLGKTLAGMGMPLAFSLKADFSGMTGAKELCIDEVVHQALVDVDEKGTEAAAATAVAIAVKAVPPPQQVREFRADHPFMFAIRDHHTGSILFLGRVADPKG